MLLGATVAVLSTPVLFVDVGALLLLDYRCRQRVRPDISFLVDLIFVFLAAQVAHFVALFCLLFLRVSCRCL